MLFLYYTKILLEREKQYEFFWNWYQQQQIQNKTNIWQNKTQYEFTQKHFKSNIYDDNTIKKLNQYSEYNKQNKYIQNDSAFQKNNALSEYHKNQHKTTKQYQQQIQQTQKQYEYQYKQIDNKQKQQQLQNQTIQQYEMQKQYHIQKRNEYQKQNIWQKQNQHINNQKNEYKQEYFILQQNENKKQQYIQKNKQKIHDIKKNTMQYDFWKYYYDFLKCDANDKTQYDFWNIENILKNQYEQITDNIILNDNNMTPVKQYTEKIIKNNILFAPYQKQNIWQKESDIQKKEQYDTVNTEVIQNIVQNSLNEKQIQYQKMQYEQQQKQSIDEETLFLHITEKLLEQRERSLRGNSFKI
ncbi:hypothetical protein AAK894_06640 [Lachnospiraceae bacterium 46-61]